MKSYLLCALIFLGSGAFAASGSTVAAVSEGATTAVAKETLYAVARGPAKHCPGTAKSLFSTSVFSTLISVTGCVTPSAEAFLVLYRSRDLDGFRVLSKSPAGGAQLYALCGFKHLRADEEAKALRQELSTSQKTAAVHAGCNGPGPMTPVSRLIAANKGQRSSTFDVMCDYLIEEGMQPYREPCDTESARPKCE